MTAGPYSGKMAEFWAQHGSNVGERFGQKLVAMFEPTPDGKTHVLDIGCGSGELVFALLNAGFSATGIDLSADLVAKAKERVAASSQPSRGHVIEADMTDFQLSRKFDI